MIQFFDEQNKGLSPDLIPRYGFGATPDGGMTAQLSYEQQVNQIINWGAKAIEISVFPWGIGGAKGKAGVPPSDESMGIIKQLVNLNNISFGIHAPYSMQGVGSESIVNVIHDSNTDAGARFQKDSTDLMQRLTYVADKTGAQWINIHTTFENWTSPQKGESGKPVAKHATVYDVASGMYIPVQRNKIGVDSETNELLWETDAEVANRINKDFSNQLEKQVSSDIYSTDITYYSFVRPLEHKLRETQNQHNNFLQELQTSKDEIRAKRELSEEQKNQQLKQLEQQEKKIKEEFSLEIADAIKRLEERKELFKPILKASFSNLIKNLSANEYKYHLSDNAFNLMEKYVEDPKFGEWINKDDSMRDELRGEISRLKREWDSARKRGKEGIDPGEKGILTWSKAIVENGSSNLAKMMENIDKYEKEKLNKKDSNLKIFVENPDIRFLGDADTTAEMVIEAQKKLRNIGRSDLAERIGMNMDTSHANSFWGVESIESQGQDKGKVITSGGIAEQWEEIKKNKQLAAIKHMHLNDTPGGEHIISPMGVSKEFGGMGIKGAETILSDLKKHGKYDKMQVVLESGALSGVGFKMSQEAIDRSNIGGYYYNTPIVRGMSPFAAPSFYSDHLFIGQNQQGQDNSYFKMTPDFKFF